jgi:hypothetical protein
MPFAKGESGNRRGRPARGRTFADLLDRDLRRRFAPPADAPDERLTRKQALVRKAVDLALAGELDALKWIVERTEGKTPERLEHSGPDGRPVEHHHVVEVKPVDYRQSIRALAPLERDDPAALRG